MRCTPARFRRVFQRHGLVKKFLGRCRFLKIVIDTRNFYYTLDRDKGNIMQPHFSDAERPALFDMQKLRLDQCWRRGEIGDATYLRSLFIMGYPPREAGTELNLLKMER